MLAAVLVGLALASAAPLLPVDDAFIHFRYAESVANGDGLRFSPQQPWSEGSSSLLWVLVLGAVGFFTGTGAVPFVALLLGVLSFVALLGVAARTVGPQAPTDEEPGDWWVLGPAIITASLVATLPSTHYWAVSGMETLAFALAWQVVFAASFDRVPLRLGVLAAALAPWLRPEGPWIGVALVVAVLAGRGPRQWRDLLRPPVVPIGLALAASTLLLLAFRRLAFDDWFALPYYAKPADTTAGLAYVQSLLMTPWGGGIAVLGVLGALAGDDRHRGALAASLAWMAANVIEGGDWMAQGRLALPWLLSLAVAAGGLANWTQLVLRVLGLTAALALALVNVRDGRLQAEFEAQDAQIHEENRLLAGWLVHEELRSVALVDVGIVSFRTGLEIVDLGGLTDPVIAHSPGPHLGKRFDLLYLTRD